MLDNNDTLTISSTLTKIGKKRLTEGNLKITKVAFADDGMNYKLINDNLSNDTILLRRTPLFDVWKDGQMGLRNKIVVENISDPKPNNRKFDYFISRESEKIVDIAGDERKFPEERKEEGNTSLLYYGKNGNDLSLRSEIEISFNHRNIFGSDFDIITDSGSRFLTVTLFDSTYFDIAVSLDNSRKYTSVLQYPNNDFMETVIENSSHNTNMMSLLSGDIELEPVDNFNMGDRNFLSAYFLSKENKNTPKTVNILSSQESDKNRNSFVIYYKGNFSYKNAGTENYQTLIEVFDEMSGRTEYIQLSIIPTTE